MSKKDKFEAKGIEEFSLKNNFDFDSTYYRSSTCIIKVIDTVCQLMFKMTVKWPKSDIHD